MHIIDISDPKNPDVIGFVDTPCGSHTATLVPDLANNRLLVYSNASANTTFGVPSEPNEPLNCRGIDIVQVPLANPAAASYLRFEPSGDPAEPVDDHHACHDTAVILGDAHDGGVLRRQQPVDLDARPGRWAARRRTRSSCTTSSSRA